MDAGKPNLLKSEVARCISFRRFLLPRRPADAGEVLAVFVDRDRVLSVIDIYVEGRVVEAMMKFGEMESLQPFPESISGQRRSPFQIVLQGDQSGANHH